MNQINDDIDLRLKELIKKDAGNAPADGWFVRKTMNRLPDKRRSRIFSPAETVSYIVSFLLICAIWIRLFASIHAAGAFAMTDILICFSLFAALLLLAGSILIPVLRHE